MIKKEYSPYKYIREVEEVIRESKDLDKAHNTDKLVKSIKGDKADENRFM
jgi:hypothetical protein